MSTNGMRYKLLGRTGLRVSELCLGAIELGFRHDFDTSGLVYGTTAAQIDDHR